MKYLFTCKNCGCTMCADSYIRCVICGSSAYTFEPFDEEDKHDSN